MKFSIIMPSWNRANIISLAINSLIDQTYSDWELIFIDDGSTDNTQEVLDKYRGDSRIKFIKHEVCRERVISWNEGMKMATGDWICFLDSDDEVLFGYLEILKHNIEKYPEYSIFHYGHLVVSLDGATVKLANDIEEREVGMAHFDSGIVGAGSFVFKRELLNENTYLPNVDNIYELADIFGERLEEWFEKNAPGVAHQKYNQADKFCGNPWGQDFVLFWLLTRESKSKKLPLLPYVAYIRTEPWLYERAFISGTMLC